MSMIKYALQRQSDSGQWEDVLYTGHDWRVAGMMNYVRKHPETVFRIVQRKVVEVVLWQKVVGKTDDRE